MLETYYTNKCVILLCQNEDTGNNRLNPTSSNVTKHTVPSEDESVNS